MEEQLITLETAKLAKEKGLESFNHDKAYRADGLLLSAKWLTKDNADVYFAPTQSLLQKWLREEKKISISIITGYTKGGFTFECWIMYDGAKEIEPILSCEIDEKYGTTFYEKTYEEALEKGLQEALKLINNR